VHFIRQKSDVAKVTADWEQMVTNRFGCSIKAIHSDNDGEYIDKEFQDWMASREILHEPTAPYTPEHNGVAERINRSLLESVLHVVTCGIEWIILGRGGKFG
jgi:transposase InsO family protein